MPVNIKEIAAHTKPLDQKIYEFLSANPDEFYTSEEIQKELGEFNGFTALGSKVGAEWMLMGLLADIAFRDEIHQTTTTTQKNYAAALTALVNGGRINCVNYQGFLRFGAARVMPAWVERPSLTE